MKKTDVLIIGGGPAGATAAIYTARAGFATKIIYKDYGALEKAERVENFYGFAKISGKSLVEKGLRQARRAGAETIKCEVVGILTNNLIDGVITADENLIDGAIINTDENLIVKTAKELYDCRVVILATGAQRDTPDIPGIAELEGRGVSYCAVCDGFFYRGKDVAVLGSGAYALHEVLDLLPMVSSVTVFTNGEEISANFPAGVMVRTEKIDAVTSRKPDETKLPGVLLKPAITLKGIKLYTGEHLDFSGLFIATGIAGATELARKIGAEFDPAGGIITDNEQRTSIPALWAAGDCTGGMKQIAKAIHEGAEAGTSVLKFLREKR
ncbi:MAG: NAD(P)/FAD-dependent oxidoreductase [Defluviitaleaceae bacterium]|nr:NAD(P)/FAD-dependent oxidoreductase [Defluviitaleaceae bacterium]